MDRVIVYDGALPQTNDVLYSNKFAMLGDSFINSAAFGRTTVVAGLACTPKSPATLQVTIDQGSIYSVASTDTAAYGDLGTDSNPIVKQGILATPATLTITPPSTSGFSQIYLVQAQLADVDAGSMVLSYFNSALPNAPYSGPANSGTSQYTRRNCVCVVALKAGAAAATGTQTVPTPDVGYVGLYAINVVNGQTQITSANISQLANAPFFPTLPSIPSHIQNGDWVYATDVGGANFMQFFPTPPVSAYVAGMIFSVVAGFTNTGATVARIGALSNQPVTYSDGSALVAGEFYAGRVAHLFYDGTKWILLNPWLVLQRPRLTTPTTFYVSPSGSDTNDGRTVGTPFLTLQRAFVEVSKYDFNGQSVTVKCADGTYSGAGFQARGQMQGAAGPIQLVGNVTNPTNCVINHTQANSPNSNQAAVSGVLGGQVDVNGFQVQSTNLNGILSNNAGTNVSYQNVVFGPCAGSHVVAQNLGFLYLNASSVYSIAGNAASHFNATNGGRIYNNGLTNISLSGTPAFSAGFLNANDGAIQLQMSFTGSATGAKYNVVDNGIVYLLGTTESAIPGSSPGTAYAGGRIDGAAGQDWVAFTPTVSTTTGSVTGAATGAWRKIDKTVFFSYSVSISAAATPGGCLVSAPPIPPSLQSAGGGKEISTTGKSVGWAIPAGGTNFVLHVADSSNAWVAGYNIVFSGFYQIAN